MTSGFKSTIFAFLALLALAAPAFADDAAGVASDAGAVAKDSVAIGGADLSLAKDRASKATNKATGNWAGQAVDSVALGYDHVFKTEKQGEKAVDQKVLDHDSK